MILKMNNIIVKVCMNNSENCEKKKYKKKLITIRY